MIQIETASKKWKSFCDQISSILLENQVHLQVDGNPVTGFRSPDDKALWIRSHSDMLRGGRYFLEDVRSAIQSFAETQSNTGRIYDYVTVSGVMHSGSTNNGANLRSGETWVRMPLAADVEYRFVKAGYLAWQASGDDEWMLRLLPSFERALVYLMKHPNRWDEKERLVKRAYTIDTLDFDYRLSPSPTLNTQFDDDICWGIMHGDCSGFYEACVLLAKMFKVAGRYEKVGRCYAVAEEIQERANKLLFNGSFYTHFHKLSAVKIPGVNEDEQLSMSNPMAINRGMATEEMAHSIIQAYKTRRQHSKAFAEWYTIDPPFPSDTFADESLEAGFSYNGGIMPLVGGELALAAFAHGEENYGFSILDQYRAMLADSGKSYLWYTPAGTPPPKNGVTHADGWGASSMLNGFVEGLCGIQDLDHGYEKVSCRPRWLAAGETEANVKVSYAASGAGFAYDYQHDPEAKSISITLTAPDTHVDLGVMIPEGCKPVEVLWDGWERRIRTSRSQNTEYVELHASVIGQSEVVVTYAGK